jgi:hypothetical protein
VAQVKWWSACLASIKPRVQILSTTKKKKKRRRRNDVTLYNFSNIWGIKIPSRKYLIEFMSQLQIE